MESLQSIIGGRNFTPPSEIEAIQEYVKRRHNARAQVSLQRDSLLVVVKSASLASTLRMEQQRLKEACNTKKRLIIRIG